MRSPVSPTDSELSSFSRLEDFLPSDVSTDTRRTRLVRRDDPGALNIKVRGADRKSLLSGLYFRLLDIGWVYFCGALCLYYFLFNAVFATVFFVSGSYRHEDSEETHWASAFHFSVQTADTIGYGEMVPATQFGNWVVAFESFLSKISLAIQTGLVFAKISQPHRLRLSIRFSEVAVVNENTLTFVEDPQDSSKGEYKTGARCLCFRIGKRRPKSNLMSTNLRLVCLKRTTLNGSFDIQFEEMDFEISQQKGRNRGLYRATPILSLPWTVVHVINESSPLHGLSLSQMNEQHIEIVAVLDGLDESVSESLQVSLPKLHRVPINI
eukprot:gene1491-2118_t